MTTSNTPIKSFSIKGLFGSSNVFIPFEKDVNIIIGENGRGKTTILNALYYVLSCNFYNLNTIVFDEIILTFKSGNIVKINKDDITFYPDETNDKFIDRLKSILSDDELISIIQWVREDKPIKEHPIYMKIRRNIQIPSHHLQRRLQHLTDSNYEIIEELKMKIKKDIPYEVLYFPTFRRIEEDLHNLGYSNMIDLDNKHGKLINFGMEDVKEHIKHITDEIKDSAIKGFSSVNGQMLNQLIHGINITDEMINDIQQPDALKIVLERIGENINSSNKEQIMSLIEKEDLTDQKYAPLVYFLSHLIKIYDQQRENDKWIKSFTQMCNKYLVNKEIIYDEESVEVFIKQKKSDKQIDLSNLSSGEKQLISIFSKIYLGIRNNFILIFDEPELSLSLEWQQQLLPDIWDSNKCNLLITATHSPFIFENDFDLNASDIDNFIEEVQYEVK